MLTSLLYRPATAKLTMALFMTAQMLGWITFARGSDPAAPAAPVPTAPPPNSLPVVRRALREFDRFLDHHPLLEERLRLAPQLADDKTFLEKTPELRDFLFANPAVAEGLKIYPRYFLNRALLRQASSPLSFQALAPFKELFQEHPRLEQALNEKPEVIRDPEFLNSHVVLRDFVAQRPALAQAFLPSAVSPHSK